MTSLRWMFIHVSQLTRCPLYVSPFFSSTSWDHKTSTIRNNANPKTTEGEASLRDLTMGCPWAVLRSERGSCRRRKRSSQTRPTNHISDLGIEMRAKGRETGVETHHLGRDPAIKKAGSDEGCGGISGARPGGGGGEGDSGSKTLVSSRREAEGKRAGEPSTENDRTERV